MKRKKGKISIVDVNFYSFMQPYTNNLLLYFFHFTLYCASSNYIQTITKASVAKKLVRKIIFWAVPPGHGGGKKRIENPNDIVIRNPGQMRALISIFILQICAGAAARSELSSPKRCWQNLNFNADMQNEQWTQIENEIYYTLLHSIEWKIPSKEKVFGI